MHSWNTVSRRSPLFSWWVPFPKMPFPRLTLRLHSLVQTCLSSSLQHCPQRDTNVPSQNCQKPQGMAAMCLTPRRPATTKTYIAVSALFHIYPTVTATRAQPCPRNSKPIGCLLRTQANFPPMPRECCLEPCPTDSGSGLTAKPATAVTAVVINCQFIIKKLVSLAHKEFVSRQRAPALSAPGGWVAPHLASEPPSSPGKRVLQPFWQLPRGSVGAQHTLCPPHLGAAQWK